MGIAPRLLVTASGQWGHRCTGILEERGQRDVESGGDFFQNDCSGTAFSALDQRNHRATDVTSRGERIETHSKLGSQRTGAGGNPRVEVWRLSGGNPLLHTGHYVQ